VTVNVLVLDNFAPTYRDHILERFPELVVHTARKLPDISVDLATIDVLIAFGIAIDDNLIRRAANLKWIQSLATGVDHFLRCPYLKPETLLTSARGIHGPPMRETVAWLMLSSARNAPQRYRDQSAQTWDRGQPWSLLHDKTAVIVGVGVSTTAIAQLLKAFGMKVLGVSRTVRPVEGFDEILPASDLPAVAARADYLINVLPGDAANHDRLNAAVFTAMKPSARFINVGRGETVDEQALIDALQSGRIAGAGLDVFRAEPLAPASPLWDMPNVIVTPHIAGFVVEYEQLMMPMLLENMGHFLASDRAAMTNVIPH
jgi:phosphoglycerate dehydrogenase-like enzyme